MCSSEKPSHDMAHLLAIAFAIVRLACRRRAAGHPASSTTSESVIAHSGSARWCSTNASVAASSQPSSIGKRLEVAAAKLDVLETLHAASSPPEASQLTHPPR